MVAKKAPEKPPYDIAHINATYNNTIVTITDKDGNPITWKSCGSVSEKYSLGPP